MRTSERFRNVVTSKTVQGRFIESNTSLVQAALSRTMKHDT